MVKAVAARSSIFQVGDPKAASITGRYVEPNARLGNPARAVLDDRASQGKTWELAVALVADAPSAIPKNAVHIGIASG